MALVSLTRLSPAKINLMLRIVGRRQDGYHELQTLFQLLDWGDQMHFKQLNSQGRHEISISGFTDLRPEDNLIHQAAMKLRPFARTSSDWHIDVQKNIPQGAGLGGGSSNAAQTLLILNEHWSCGLDRSQLMKLGAQLGADVPIFIFGRSALATGIGDHLTAMHFDTPCVLLVLPELHINTSKLFSSEQLERNQQPLSQSQLQHKDLWINDFFPLLLNVNPTMAKLYQQLSKLMPVRLSGTGSAMFGLFSQQQEAKRVLKQLPTGLKAHLVVPLPGSAD